MYMCPNEDPSPRRHRRHSTLVTVVSDADNEEVPYGICVGCAEMRSSPTPDAMTSLRRKIIQQGRPAHRGGILDSSLLGLRLSPHRVPYVCGERVVFRSVCIHLAVFDGNCQICNFQIFSQRRKLVSTTWTISILQQFCKPVSRWPMRWKRRKNAARRATGACYRYHDGAYTGM